MEWGCTSNWSKVLGVPAARRETRAALAENGINILSYVPPVVTGVCSRRHHADNRERDVVEVDAIAAAAIRLPGARQRTGRRAWRCRRWRGARRDGALHQDQELQLRHIPESRNKTASGIENDLSRLGTTATAKRLWALHDQYLDEGRFDTNCCINTRSPCSSLECTAGRRTGHGALHPVAELVGDAGGALGWRWPMLTRTNATPSATSTSKSRSRPATRSLAPAIVQRMVGEMRQKEMIEATTPFGNTSTRALWKGCCTTSSTSRAASARSCRCPFPTWSESGAACEGLTPDGVVRLLNQILSAMVCSIRPTTASSTSRSGDSTSMAFGAPRFCWPAEHAAQACFSALEQEAASSESGHSSADVDPQERSGHQGAHGDADVAPVGHLGSDDARSYTATRRQRQPSASRLESVTKVTARASYWRGYLATGIPLKRAKSTLSRVMGKGVPPGRI